MLEKMVTTKMSADKKKLQNRFSKIRSESTKASKWIAAALFALLLVIIISISVYMAVTTMPKDAQTSDTIRITVNGQTLRFENEPYLVKDAETGTEMAYFPLEEFAKQADYLTQITTEGGNIVINLPTALDRYIIAVNQKEIRYEGEQINSLATRNTDYAPVETNNLVYIPYEYIEYLWIDANNYGILGGILYQNEAMNVQFEIPLGWLGKYVIDETLQDTGNITINHKRIAEKYNGAGMLCRVYKELDETLAETLTMLGNQTVVWQNQEYAYIVGRPTDVQHPIWADRDKEDITLAEEYEKMAQDIPHIESTFSLINDVKTPNIANAEKLSYAQIKELQRQADNGHFPWRLDPEQVIQAYLSGLGYAVEEGSLISFAGNGEACSGTYAIGSYTHRLELFKPVDKTEHGIWIVRSYRLTQPATLENVTFYRINPNDNTLDGEFKKQPDGWYRLPKRVGSFINFNGAVPSSVTAYFTPAGTDTEQYKKQVGYANPPWEQIPLSVLLTFFEEDTMGHLQYEFHYESGETVRSEYFKVLIES